MHSSPQHWTRIHTVAVDPNVPCEDLEADVNARLFTSGAAHKKLIAACPRRDSISIHASKRRWEKRRTIVDKESCLAVRGIVAVGHKLGEDDVGLPRACRPLRMLCTLQID